MEVRGIDIQVSQPQIARDGRNPSASSPSPVSTLEVSSQVSEPVSQEAVQAAVDKANQFAETSGARLNFSIDDKTHEVIVKVIDEESGEVIRQIPPEEMVRIGDHVRQLMGILFNKYA